MLQARKNSTAIKKPKKPELTQTIISQTDYIDKIIKNNIGLIESCVSIKLEKYLSNYNEKNFFQIFSKMKYLCYLSKNHYKNKRNDKILAVFLYSVIFLFEIENNKLKKKKELFLKYFLILLDKYYCKNKLNDTELMIIIKFIIFASIYEREEIYSVKERLLTCLINKQIRNYDRFKYAIEIIKKINNTKITIEFCEFIKEKIIKHKPNLFLVTEKTDILEILYIKDENNKILDFLSNIYAFKYNKTFLDVFMKKIKEQYHIRNKDNNSIEILDKLNRSILLLKNLQIIEEGLYNNDLCMLSHGFVCNNDRYNGITVNSVILQTEFTIIFSFNYIPEETNNKIMDEYQLKDNTLKFKRKKTFSPEIPELPIINFLSENNRKGTDGFSFFIKQGCLYHRVINSEDSKRICDVKENQTYICYYSFKEYDHYKIFVKTHKNAYCFKDPNKKILKKNLTLQVGKFNHQNFEGYIGPILFFKKYFGDDFKNFIFGLKGNYEKILFMQDYVLDYVDKYDRNANLNISEENSININLINNNKSKSKEEIINNLALFVTPVYKGSKLDRLLYVNSTFVETKVTYYIKPKIENGATFFFRNNNTPFEFLKYEGMNYLILIIELIISNVDNIENETHQKMLLNIFINIIDYIQELIYLLNLDFYIEEIRHVLFAIKKCINKICQKIKMVDELSIVLNKWINSLTSLNPQLQNKKSDYLCIIRNEICKFLLDTELYDLKNYSSIEYFFIEINNCLQKKSKGLVTMEIFKKIISFSLIFEQVFNNYNSKLRHNNEYKKFKLEFIKLVRFFLSQSENIEYSSYFCRLFSCDIDFNYKKYQIIKIFYLSSDYFFSHIDKKNFIYTWKFFIDLYEYLYANETYTNISEKEAQILMAICLRFIFEYPITGDFFKQNKIKQKKNIIPGTIKKKDKKYMTTYTLNKDYMWEIEDNQEEIKEIGESKIDNKNNISNNNNSPSNKERYRKTIYTTKRKMKNNMEFSENKNHKESNQYVERRRAFSCGKLKRNTNKSKNFQKFRSNIGFVKKSLSNSKYNKNKTINIVINDYFNEKTQLDLVNSQLESSDYLDYCSYYSLFPKLCVSTNFNDYCFKSILLLILETNNEITLTQDVKFNFISKVKCYEDLKNPEYAPFLKLQYFNRETKQQLLQLINLIKLNVNKLSHVPFEIFLYIIMEIINHREDNKCVFNHVIKSKKICNKIFLLAFRHNNIASDSIFKNFSPLIKLTMPYHRKPFIMDFLYDISEDKDLKKHSQVLLNTLLLMSCENDKKTKFFYQFKINIIILLYRVLKINKLENKEYNFSDKGLGLLFDDNLVLSRFNILKDISGMKKKKCYAELLFESMINLCIKSKNDKYILLTYQMFIGYIQHFKSTNIESQSVVYYLDQLNSCCNKNNPIIKFLPKNEVIDTPSLCVQFLLKTIKYWNKCEDDNNVKNMLASLASAFYMDAKLIFSEYRSRRAKYKNQLFYNYLRDVILESNSNKKQILLDNVLQMLSSSYQKYSTTLKSKKSTNIESNYKPDMLDRSVSFNLSNYNSMIDCNLDDSFSSCNSSKNIRVTCSNNQKKKYKSTQKGTNLIDDLVENLDKGEELFNFEEEMDLSNSTRISKISMSENMTNQNSSSNSSKLEKSVNSVNNNRQRKILDLGRIETLNKVILFPKLTLLEQIFGIYFTEIFFYNEPFIKMKHYFEYIVKKNNEKDIKTENFFNYPIIMKNYIPNGLYFGGLFLKHDLNFFNNHYFHISHPYFIEKAKQSMNRRIFQKVSDQNDINKFILDKKDPNNFTFYVDLITNRNVVFGELIITKYLIYFQNIDKEEFLKGKDEAEVEKWLLCSPQCDYSSRNKKLYIFKKEILEIINRRFLYLFQACELYLKNGKSYYFNFYSEEKKIEFFSIISERNYNIKIISDLKSDFKKRGYSKKWLNNEITTLEYLLFINKYSCRSYNDINQYPVFPWLLIYGEKMRDLQYTICAQEEEQRMMLREKYPFSSEQFPYHYTTHYSNASYLIYYLIRINPFTDNQITLQVNKFDVPDRQFNSIDEFQKILNTTKQPREVIPEFFISTEFFYNYNCNYFGVKNNKEIVNNLLNKKSFKTPLEFILNNAVLLESPQIKSKMNFFFDNIFGIGQMGGCERCNTYDKYSYQEMIDLRHKIEIFQEKGLSLMEIKKKIERKSNKIISFGQTPFKLLENKHAQWEKPNSEDISLCYENNFSIKETSHQIIHLDVGKNFFGKKYLYVLTKIDNNNFELNFFDLYLKEDKENNNKTIQIQKKIKLFSKLHLFNSSSFLFAYKYNPKFIMISFNLALFIFCHLTDNSFGIFNSKGELKSVLTDSLITCIIKGPGYIFYTGHIDGKIIEWELSSSQLFINNQTVINLNEMSIKYKKSFIAHKDSISGIYYSQLLGLLITSGDDNKIFIRKFYDLSLLTVIDTNNKLCINIKMSHCYLYILFFDPQINKHIVEVYSVNGILVAKSDYCFINNIDLDKEGNLLIGYFNENKITVYNPPLTNKICDINLRKVPLNSDNKKNKKKKANDNKEYFEVDGNIIFQSFCYKRESSSIYCSYSNGVLYRKYIGIYNKNK